MFWMLTIAALAGYGDAVDGHPNPAERSIHLWTNAARIEPVAFRSELSCWSSFSEHERAPKSPLALADELSFAARFHADDMAANDHFSHSSSDGTDFGTRVSRFYGGMGIGENIALGAPTPRSAVLGWLCSAGHRENIMSDWVELGTGYATGPVRDFGGRDAPYYVQNFGSRNVSSPVLRMGAAERSGGEATFYVDYDGAAPDVIEVVVEGEAIELDLTFGTEATGVWSVALPVSGECARYYFRAVAGEAVHRFPEEGAYGVGTCADADDVDAAWFAPASTPVPDDDALADADLGGGGGGCAGDVPWDAIDDGGCATAPFGGPLALAGLLLLRRRRRGDAAR